MRNITTVFKKEFYRVMSDKRLVFTAILMPGLIIYLMYSLMGSALQEQTDEVKEHKMIVYTENMPNEFKIMVYQSEVNVSFEEMGDFTRDDIIQQMKDGETDLLLVFPSNFADLTSSDYTGDELPNVETYYNSAEENSDYTHAVFTTLLYQYGQAIGVERFGVQYYSFSVNLDDNTHDIVDLNQAIGKGFAMLLPMLIVMFLFSGAMSIGPDSIAGEKERGTIATLLVTPIKRSELAIGKVLSLSVISLFSAASSFTGIFLSLPKLMQSEEMTINIYGPIDLLMLFTVLIATVLVIVGIISVISAYAKTIKEASMLILPFYFVTIIIGVTSMFSGEATSNTIMYLIPLYNSINVIISILTFDISPLAFLLTVGSSVVYVSIFIFILNKLFQSEKVMFAK